jgi:hypothetical protein
MTKRSLDARESPDFFSEAIANFSSYRRPGASDCCFKIFRSYVKRLFAFSDAIKSGGGGSLSGKINIARLVTLSHFGNFFNVYAALIKRCKS